MQSQAPVGISYPGPGLPEIFVDGRRLGFCISRSRWSQPNLGFAHIAVFWNWGTLEGPGELEGPFSVRQGCAPYSEPSLARLEMYLSRVPWGVRVACVRWSPRPPKLPGCPSPGVPFPRVSPSHALPFHLSYVSKWQLAHPPMGRKKPLDPSSREVGVSAEPSGRGGLPSSPEWSGRQGSWGGALGEGRGKAPQCHDRRHRHRQRCHSLCISQARLCIPSLTHSLLSPHVQG